MKGSFELVLIIGVVLSALVLYVVFTDPLNLVPLIDELLSKDVETNLEHQNKPELAKFLSSKGDVIITTSPGNTDPLDSYNSLRDNP